VSKKKQAAWAGLALLVIFALVLLVPRRSAPSLPNGRTIERLRVTRGTAHSASWGNRLNDYIWPVLPRALRARPMFYRRMTTTFATSSNATVLWVDVQSDGLWRQPSERRHDSFECTLVDSNGVAVAASGLEFGAAGGWYGDGRSMRYAVFPPVTGKYTVRIQQRVARDGKITLRQPPPPGTSLMGAELYRDGLELPLPEPK
jgi:hypothetical protein